MAFLILQEVGVEVAVVVRESLVKPMKTKRTLHRTMHRHRIIQLQF